MTTGIVNIYNDFSNYGGAQQIAMALFENLNPVGENFLMSFTPYTDITEKIHIDRNQYLQLSTKNIFRLKEYTFISHHRKSTTFIELVNKIFFLKLKIIHVAHNEFNSLKYFSLFPRHIVAVSEKVKKNHIDYFNIPEDNIKIIYNGVKDVGSLPVQKDNKNTISILYPARINNIKGQIRLIQNIKQKLDKNVIIHFAGIGEDYKQLKILCKNSRQFQCLGFVDISEIIQNYDFVMLFSENEGLPLSLIEAGMYSKPIITNRVGGNEEIIEDERNGYLRNTYEEIIELLNQLPQQSIPDYQNMCHNSRLIYEEKFRFKNMIKKYENYLKGI